MRRTGSWLSGVVLAGVMAAFPPFASAQVVVGHLRSSADRQPLPGAIVALRDSHGQRLAYTITDGRGGFSLRAPGPGRYRLEAEQIGFETGRSQLFTVGVDTLEYPFSIAVKPVTLSSIEVATRERGCERRPDGSDVALLWGEVRKALTATERTAARRGVTYTNHLYRITTAPGGHTVLDEQGSTSTAHSYFPFAVASVADLARDGFSRRESADLYLLGPDASALTSDEFLDGHCFRLAVDSQRPNLVGLGFEPMRRRRDYTDIRGTLWVDRESAALRRLEYSYVNLPDPYARFGADGELDFERLGNGSWVIREWRIRSPALGVDSAVGSPRGVRVPTGIRRRGTIEQGGVVLRAVAGSEVQYVAGGDAVVEGAVLSQRGGVPVTGARVLLTGTGLSATTDARGHYRIAGVKAGRRYGLTFSHELARDLGLALALDSIEVSAGAAVTHDLYLALDEVQRRLCASTFPGSPGPGLVYGVITDSAGVPIRGAHSWAEWKTAGSLVRQNVRAGERSGGDGRYYVCGLPLDAPMTISVQVGVSVQQLLLPNPENGVPIVRLDFSFP